MKITITRALSELKLLKSRYEKAVIKDMKVIAVQHGSKLRPPYNVYKVDDFRDQILPGYQSIEDLEKRIIEIKTKIDQSNFTTMVKIGSKEMTVLEAIEMKNFIPLKTSKLKRLKTALSEAKDSYNGALNENKMKIEKQVTEATAASGQGIGKLDPDLEQKIVEQVEALYEVKLVDPLKLEDLVKKLETEIDEFTNNVDFVLSESNSITTIEVSD